MVSSRVKRFQEYFRGAIEAAGRCGMGGYEIKIESARHQVIELRRADFPAYSSSSNPAEMIPHRQRATKTTSVDLGVAPSLTRR